MRLPLILHPRPSAALAAAMVAGHGAAAVAVLSLALPLWAKLGGALGLVVSAIAAIRQLRRALPAALVLGADGLIRLDWRGEGSFEGRAAAETTVLPWLVVLALETAGRRPRFLPLAADSLAADEFRDLRLWLRWRSRERPAADS